MASDTIDMQIWLPHYAANLPHCRICRMATDSVFTFYLPHEYTIQVATCTLDVHISCRPVQLAAETALTTDCGNYHKMVTTTNHSEKFDATMKNHVSGYCHSNSANSVAHGRACVWQLSQSFNKIVAAWGSLFVATITVISVS